MPTIRVSEVLRKKMKPAEFEAYLLGSGKPPGIEVTVTGDEVTWGEDAPVMVEEVVEPELVAEIDYTKMTKLEIEAHVRETHDVELDRRLTKGDLVAEALRLEKEGE